MSSAATPRTRTRRRIEARKLAAAVEAARRRKPPVVLPLGGRAAQILSLMPEGIPVLTLRDVAQQLDHAPPDRRDAEVRS